MYLFLYYGDQPWHFCPLLSNVEDPGSLLPLNRIFELSCQTLSFLEDVVDKIPSSAINFIHVEPVLL